MKRNMIAKERCNKMKAIMLQGTASDVGKSVICTAFCRYFFEEGFRVAPFKSQNMALNSYVTRDGGEIGRAQGIQAEAAGIEPTVDMNPVLLKPTGEMVSEVILHGRRFAELRAGSFHHELDSILASVQQSLNRLSRDYDVLVMEGAGSPAEINLKERDIANMWTARMADAPVLLIADIDRGGMFASVVGTLELLEPDERRRVKGIIINKFRGDKSLLEPGIRWLEQRTGIPVLGVLPYVEVGIDPEDSLSLTELALKGNQKETADLDVAVIRFPRIANFTDFSPLMDHPDLSVRFVKAARELGRPDVIILPGTENPKEDFAWLKKTGLEEKIRVLKIQGSSVIGIGGGFPMLGTKWVYPDCESEREEAGLGLLPMEIQWNFNTPTSRSQAKPLAAWGGPDPVEGYEIHSARPRKAAGVSPLFELSDGRFDGAVSEDGEVWGTGLHGVFDNPSFTVHWICHLHLKKGLPKRKQTMKRRREEREKIYSLLAQWIREHMDMEQVKKIMGISR
jgi:adenosylcobyric acid synthase